MLNPSQRVTEMLQTQNAMRTAVFLRKKSPLYSLENDEVLVKACGTLGIDPVASRAELMAIYKWDHLTIFVFNVWYDDYDWATAHHQVNLPVVLVDYGKRLSSVKVCSQAFCDEVNHFVAKQQAPRLGCEAALSARPHASRGGANVPKSPLRQDRGAGWHCTPKREDAAAGVDQRTPAPVVPVIRNLRATTLRNCDYKAMMNN